jgi:hypothetical protein
MHKEYKINQKKTENIMHDNKLEMNAKHRAAYKWDDRAKTGKQDIDQKEK